MTKKQFIKLFKGFSRNEILVYTDFVKKYKGKLSYYKMFALLKVAEMFGKNFPDEALCYVEVVMRD